MKRESNQNANFGNVNRSEGRCEKKFKRNKCETREMTHNANHIIMKFIGINTNVHVQTFSNNFNILFI